MRSVIALMWVALVVACNGTQGTTKGTLRPLAPADYYPLATGNAWSYDVDTGESLPTLAVTRVESFDGQTGEVRTGHGTVRYEVRPDGLYVPRDDAWLFRVPLQPGTSWRARGAREGSIVSADLVVETAAGTFKRCIEVVERGGVRGLEVRTVYCPGVGPVSVDSTMRSKTTGNSVSVHAKLRGYSLNR